MVNHTAWRMLIELQYMLALRGINTTLRTGRRGTPHLVVSGFRVTYSVAYFAKAKRFTVFHPYGVGATRQERHDARKVSDVITYLQEGRQHGCTPEHEPARQAARPGGTGEGTPGPRAHARSTPHQGRDSQPQPAHRRGCQSTEVVMDEPIITKIEQWREVPMDQLQHTIAFFPPEQDGDFRLRQRKFDGVFTAALTEGGELRVYVSPLRPPDDAVTYRVYANDYSVVLFPALTRGRPLVWDRHATRFFERTYPK